MRDARRESTGARVYATDTTLTLEGKEERFSLS